MIGLFVVVLLAAVAAIVKSRSYVPERSLTKEAAVASIDKSYSAGPAPSLPKATAIANAKTVQLAVAAYSQDYDDRFPPAKNMRAGLQTGCLTPYLRVGPSATEGFVYLLDGQARTSITAPNTAPLGYFPYVGGCAILYADGHVDAKDGATTP